MEVSVSKRRKRNNMLVTGHNLMDFSGLLLRPLLLLQLQLWKSSVKHIGGLPVLLAEITGNKEDTLKFQFSRNSTVYLDYYQIRN